MQLPEGVVLVIVQDTSHAQKASVFSSLLKSLEHSCYAIFVAYKLISIVKKFKDTGSLICREM